MVGFLNDDQRFDIDFVLLNLGGELKTRWDKPDGSGIINVSAYFLQFNSLARSPIASWPGLRGYNPRCILADFAEPSR